MLALGLIGLGALIEFVAFLFGVGNFLSFLSSSNDRSRGFDFGQAESNFFKLSKKSLAAVVLGAIGSLVIFAGVLVGAWEIIQWVATR